MRGATGGGGGTTGANAGQAVRSGHCVLALAVAVAAAAVLSLGVATVTEAQYTRTEPPKARFRVGPVRFTPRLELRNAGKDTNVYLDPTDALADTSAILRASINAFAPVGRRLRLVGEGWLDWTYFERYDDETSVDPGGRGRAEVDVGPLTLVGGGGALRARQISSTDIDERTRRSEGWVFGGLEWRLTRNVSLSGGSENRRTRYASSGVEGDPITSASLDRDTLTGQVDARYRLTSMTTLLLTGQSIEDTFVVAEPGFATTQSYRYLAGFEFAERAFVSGRFLAGFRDFPASKSGSLPSYRGPSFSADLKLPLQQIARFTGGVLRDVYVSSTPATTADERTRNSYILLALHASAEFDLPLKLVGRLSAGYDQTDYLRPVDVAGESLDRRDRLYSYGATLLRSFSESFRIGGTVTYYERKSTIPGQTYERWVYGVSAELVP